MSERTPTYSLLDIPPAKVLAKRPKTFYRWEDGTTYWQVAGSWIGAPTFKDGTADAENGSYITDFDLSTDEIQALESYLDGRANKGRHHDQKER